MAVAALLGTGLIGASIGIGLRGLGWTVVGWDPDGASGQGAVDVARFIAWPTPSRKH